MSTFRWGIAGCGSISGDFTKALLMLKTEGHQVAACAARGLKRAQDFAKQYDITKAYGSYQELAEDPNIDIVYVATVSVAHCDVTCFFLNAGKNVLCEKPMALNTAQVQVMVETARKNNVFLMEGFWSRCFPAYQKLREELQAGTIGEVLHIAVNFGFRGMNQIDNIAKRSLGGGAMLALGCYNLQLILMVYGNPPTDIQSSGLLSKDGVDTYETVALKFSGDRTAQMTCSGDVTLSNEAILHGTKGCIKIPNFWAPSEITVNGEKFEFPLPVSAQPMKLLNSEGFVYEAESCRECILKGQKENPKMSLKQSLELVKVSDIIRNQIGVVYDVDTV